MKNLILSVIIILSSFSVEAQIGFKAKKLGDKLNSKFLDKTSQAIGIDDNFIFRKKFEMENDQYIFENDTIRFTLNFISDPRSTPDEQKTALKSLGRKEMWCDDYDAVLEIRNLGGTDIKFRRGQRMGFGRDGGKELKRVINAKKLDDNLAPSLWGIHKIVLNDRLMLEAISNPIGFDCQEKDRVYAVGDPDTYGDLENSALYMRYKVVPIDTKTKNKSLYFEFEDQYKIDLFDYEPNYVTLTANSIWNKNWRETDSDYAERLSKYLTENNVGGVFSNKKNKKDKKKN